MKDKNIIQWLIERKKGLGASDISAVMGINPYKTAIDVFIDKTTPSIEYSESITIRRGKFLEPFVAQLFEEATTYSVKKNADENGKEIVFRHPIEDFMTATPDYFFYKPEETLLEIKTSVGQGAIKWFDGIPDYILMQLQHQMFVCLKKTAVLCTLINDDFNYIDVERNEELIERMLLTGSIFWHNHVLPNIMPEPTTIDDYKKVFKYAKQNSILVVDENMLETLDKISKCKEKLKEQKALCKQQEQELDEYLHSIKMLMRDYETMVFDGQILATYKNTMKGHRTLHIKQNKQFDI